MSKYYLSISGYLLKLDNNDIYRLEWDNNSNLTWEFRKRNDLDISECIEYSYLELYKRNKLDEGYIETVLGIIKAEFYKEILTPAD